MTRLCDFTHSDGAQARTQIRTTAIKRTMFTEKLLYNTHHTHTSRLRVSQTYTEEHTATILLTNTPCSRVNAARPLHFSPSLRAMHVLTRANIRTLTNTHSARAHLQIYVYKIHAHRNARCTPVVVVAFMKLNSPIVARVFRATPSPSSSTRHDGCMCVCVVVLATVYRLRNTHGRTTWRRCDANGILPVLRGHTSIMRRVGASFRPVVAR